MKFLSIFLILLTVGFTCETKAQSEFVQATDKNAEKPQRFYFAFSTGVNYIQPHYVKGANRQIPEAYEEDMEMDFKSKPGIFIGSTINYRLHKNWHLSSEVAYHSMHFGYNVSFPMPASTFFRSERIDQHQLSLIPVSITRLIRLDHNWHVPIRLGASFIINLATNSSMSDNFYSTIPRSEEKEDYRIYMNGGGIIMETGIARKAGNGEISLRIAPVINRFYRSDPYRRSFKFTAPPPRHYYVYLGISGAIVKVQYAFK